MSDKSKHHPNHEDVVIRVNQAVGVVVDGNNTEDDVNIVADFPIKRAPLISIGEKVTALFDGGNLSVPISSDGRVVFRSDGKSRRRYEFHFRGQAQGILSPLIDRRRSVRVRPSATDNVHLLIDPRNGDEEFEVVVKDISGSGLRFHVPHQHERTLLEATKVGLRIVLPEENDHVSMAGRIRYRRLIGSSINFGIEFEDDGSDRFQREQARLVRYVMRRHMDFVRRLRKAA